MKGSKMLVTAIGMALLLSVAVAGVSWAQGPGYGTRDGSGPLIGGEFGPGVHTEDGPLGVGPATGEAYGHRGQRHGNANSLISTVTTTLNMSRTELMSRLRAGESIADVAAGQSVTVDEVVEAFVTARMERLQARVTAGDLSQEEADQLMTQMRDRVQDRLTQLGETTGNGAFIDENGDGVCDRLGEGTGNGAFVDENGDGVCDHLGEITGDGAFVDADGDGVCDHLGTGAMQHRGQRNR